MPYESTKIHNSIWRKRLEIRILSLNPQIIEELVRPVVHNQLVREICLFQQRIEPFVVGYLERDMCIAAKNRRHLVLLTQTQDLQIIISCHCLLALWSQ